MTHANTSPAPHSLDAEKTVLGAILLDPEVMLDVSATLTADDFYDPIHADVYAAMQELHDERAPIDFVTLNQRLEGNRRIEAIGGSGFIGTLATSVPTSSHARQYAEIVRQMSLRRQIAKMGSDMSTLAQSGDHTPAQLLDATEQQLVALSRTSGDSQLAQLDDLRDERYEHYAAAYKAEDPSELFGITTGFGDLDQMLAGLPAGDLVVIAARPGMGKTALALDIALHVAGKLQKTVTMFSLEMSKEQLGDRIFAGAMNISTHDLKRGKLTEEQFRGMGAAFDALGGYPLYLDDTAVEINQLRSLARRHHHQHGTDLLIVDYLQLTQATQRLAGDNRVQQIGFISQSLKQLARELHCPVLVLSQLNRACESPPRPPVLSDLRDSGTIEQDASTVLMLYREGYYNEDCANPDITDVYVRKNRQGPTGRVELRFNAQRMTFQSVSRRDDEPPHLPSESS